MIAYKLFKQRRDGSIGPLFINARQRLDVGTWYDAEDKPTKGYAHRPGWHAVSKPHAPHLKQGEGSGRVWARVELEGVQELPRPASQGATWLLAGKLRILEILEF